MKKEVVFIDGSFVLFGVVALVGLLTAQSKVFEHDLVSTLYIGLLSGDGRWTEVGLVSFGRLGVVIALSTCFPDVQRATVDVGLLSCD